MKYTKFDYYHSTAIDNHLVSSKLRKQDIVWNKQRTCLLDFRSKSHRSVVYGGFCFFFLKKSSLILTVRYVIIIILYYATEAAQT